ncbi:short-chain dehydrogenase [Flavobacterium akiainvivens]|uniref:Short-chain dehydrogenase n=1 Tax=Flavobacterium akiainvivens TaxID=1202724 RepID=A0A0M8MC99_9FLAO|nr:SDR family NAD(P)-dependent oxidoreductase [Flavobacterium akiainvivens]KOS05774.1 short-chain dehydrogenase [Flavobacterium akiainvivens]
MSNQKVWFITGASKGMGLEVAKTVLANGGKVIATSRNLKEQIVSIGEASETLLPLKVDITNEVEVKSAIEKGIETFGQIDVVVNNAGYNLLGNMEELSDAEFRQTMNVNVFGMANVIRNVLPHLRKNKSGHIINTSSMMGYMSYPANGSYSATKFAVIGLSEALSQEVASFGIKVTILAPGTFRTSFMSDSSLAVAKNKIDDYNLEQQVELFKSYDGKQPGNPAKLAEVLFQITKMSNPPLHLPLGSDSYNAILELRKNEQKELEKWKELSLSTDFK